MKLEKNVIKPSSVLIEQTAADLCVAFYEVGRSQGLISKYKTAKSYVHHHIEKFVPKAVETLLEILCNPETSKDMKDAISDALIERANDPDLSFLNQKIDWKEPERKIEIIRASAFEQSWNKARKDILNG